MELGKINGHESAVIPSAQCSRDMRRKNEAFRSTKAGSPAGEF